MNANAKSAGKKISSVTRQMSPNSDLPTPARSAFRSVTDFIAAYETTDKTIADLTVNFVGAADLAKQKQDLIVPYLAVMQSMLSKKGVSHHLVIEAREKGHKIPWWSAYYGQYKERLWESLRTMERRIAQYRKDPSVGTIKPGKDTKPKHLTQLEHKLLGTATCNREVIVDLRAGRVEEAIAKLDKNTPTQDRIDEYFAHGVKRTQDNPDGEARVQPHDLEQQSVRIEPIEKAPALSPSMPTPQRATYQDWENHQIPVLDFKLKYFADASSSFVDRYGYSFKGSAFKRILLMLREKPDQVLANAQDFAQLAVVLRGAADNAKLLAAVITTALNTTPEPPSPPPPSKPPRSTSSQASPSPPSSPSGDPRSEERDPGTRTPSKLEEAEAWLRQYLKNGPMPIPDSYIKSGLCRYNYAPDQLPPYGIGTRTIDQAIINLGVQRLPLGPRGGIRWQLPTLEKKAAPDVTIKRPPQSEGMNEQD